MPEAEPAPTENADRREQWMAKHNIDPAWAGVLVGSIWGFVMGWFMCWLRLMVKHNRRL